MFAIYCASLYTIIYFHCFSLNIGMYAQFTYMPASDFKARDENINKFQTFHILCLVYYTNVLDVNFYNNLESYGM